jgi:hypothetical protein
MNGQRGARYGWATRLETLELLDGQQGHGTLGLMDGQQGRGTPELAQEGYSGSETGGQEDQRQWPITLQTLCN